MSQTPSSEEPDLTVPAPDGQDATSDQDVSGEQGDQGAPPTFGGGWEPV